MSDKMNLKGDERQFYEPNSSPLQFVIRLPAPRY